jgi:hypothetical protein
MAQHFAFYDTTPANWVADTKAQITTSTDWSNITANIVKATTTRGAEMVLDLNKAAPVNNYATVAFWRTHNGSSGTDEITRYLHWKYQSGGTTSNSLHCLVSASKEHLLLQVEGPYGSESNTDHVESGSKRTTLIMADIVPYHGGDTTETVAVWSNIVNTQSTSNGNQYIHVARNQADTGSWLPASLTTINTLWGQDAAQGAMPMTLQHIAKGDGKTYLFPYVVIENQDGLRGRLNNMYWAGWSRSAINGEGGGLTEGSTVTYGGSDYVIRKFFKALNISSSSSYSPFGYVPASTQYGFEPLIAVKKT